MTINRQNAQRPPPPDDFLTWLDYAVSHMDTRMPYLEQGGDGSVRFSRAEMEAAVLQELDELRLSAKAPDTFPMHLRRTFGTSNTPPTSRN